MDKEPIGRCRQCGAFKYKEDLFTGQYVIWCENGHYTTRWHTIVHYKHMVNEVVVNVIKPNMEMRSVSGVFKIPLEHNDRVVMSKERFEDSDYSEDDVAFKFGTSERIEISPNDIDEYDKEHLYHDHSEFGTHDLDRGHRLKPNKEGRRFRDIDHFLSHLEEPKQVGSL